VEACKVVVPKAVLKELYLGWGERRRHFRSRGMQHQCFLYRNSDGESRGPHSYYGANFFELRARASDDNNYCTDYIYITVPKCTFKYNQLGHFGGVG
jgi:hypothetical protein